MLDTGLLFEEFFNRVASPLVPAFAFLTIYSRLVIVSGCVCRVTDRFTDGAQLHISGELTFPDALYFSMITVSTVSTVGYGDIVPYSNEVKAVVTVQIVLGILLLLFGFYELINYTRNRTPHSDE